MDIDQDDEEPDDDGNHDDGNGYAPAMVDPVAAAIALTDLVDTLYKAYKAAITDKANKARLRAVVKLDQQAANAVTVRDEAQAQAAAIVAKIERDTTAFAERARVLEEREAKFEASVAEAHAHLRKFYDGLAEEDRRIRYRIMASADLLHGYNERLQSLPDWQQIKQMVPDLPPDQPALVAEAASREVTTDWTGQHNFIAGSSLTRTVPS
jgi:hypothetical protein